MSSRELYRRFVSLCQKWPKDETKVGRDFGEFFRKKLGEQFPHGELSQLKDTRSVESALSSLERIANNHYFNENPLLRSSSTGNSLEECRALVSTVGLKSLQEQEEGPLVKRIKQTLNIKLIMDDKSNVKEEKSSHTQKHIKEK